MRKTSRPGACRRRLRATADGLTGKGADDARRLAGLLHKMAAAPPPIREAAREALIPSLDTMLDLLRRS